MNTLDLLFDWMLNGSLRASVLALLVMAVRALTKNRLPAHWRYALWLPVLAALVLPGIPLLPAWMGKAELQKQTELAVTSAPVSPASPQPTVSPVRVDENSSPPVSSPMGTPTFTPTPAQPVVPDVLPQVQPSASPAIQTARAAIPWWKISAFVWLAGIVLAVGFVGGSYLLTLHRVRRRSVPVSPELSERIATISQSLNLRHAPRVCLSTAVASPAVCGWLRPALLLNATFPAELTDDEADMVLRHELTHIRRGDLLLNPLLCLLLALHWFNPLLWLAFSRIRADREAACDADVLHDATDARRIAYGQTLLKMETAYPPSGMCLGFVGILQRGSLLRDRIQSIIARPKLTTLMKATLAFGIIGLAVLGLAKAEEARKFVTVAEFKQHFERVGMAETMHHTEFLGITNGVAEIKVSDMNPLTRRWNERRLAIEVEKLDPALRAKILKSQPNPDTSKVDKPNPSKASVADFPGRGDWGAETNGLVCRITPERSEYLDGEAMRVLVEIRNASGKPVTLAFEPRAHTEEVHKLGPPSEEAGLKFKHYLGNPNKVSTQLGWFPKPLSPAAHAKLSRHDGSVTQPIPVVRGAGNNTGSFALGPDEVYSEIQTTSIGLSVENMSKAEPQSATLSAEIGLSATSDRGQTKLKSNPVVLKFFPEITSLPFGMAATRLTGDKTEFSVTVSGAINAGTLRPFTVSKKDLGNTISKDDLIFPALEEHQKAIFNRYDKDKNILPSFSDWYALESAAAKLLFPSLRFARIAWDQKVHPEAKDIVVGRAAGIVNIVGVDKTNNRIEVEMWGSGSYEAFGALLAKNRIRIRNGDDAKTVWNAFCELHDTRWQEHPCEKKSDAIWHLGNWTHEGVHYFYDVNLDAEQTVTAAGLKSEKAKRIVDLVYVVPNGYRGPVYVAQAREVLPEVAERQKNTIVVTTVDEKGEGVTVGGMEKVSGWEYRESVKQRDGVKIKTADDRPADDEVAWRQIGGFGPWKRAFRPEGFGAYYIGTRAEADTFRAELERLVNL